MDDLEADDRLVTEQERRTRELREASERRLTELERSRHRDRWVRPAFESIEVSDPAEQ